MNRIAVLPLRSTGTLTDMVGTSIVDGLRVDALQGESPLRALVALCRARLTGLVGFRSPEETLVLRLKGGQVTLAASSTESDDEALMRALLETGATTTEKLREIAIEVENTGADLGRLLLGRKVVGAGAIMRGMRMAASARVVRVLQMESADLIVGPAKLVGHIGRPELVAVDPRPLLAAELRRRLQRYFYRDVEAALAVAHEGWLRVPDEVQPVLDAMALGPREQHAIEKSLNGVYGLEEFLRVSILSKNESARLLITLFLFGLVRQEEEPSDAAVMDVDQLRTHLRRVATADLFVRLDRHWSTHPEDLEGSYRKILDRFGPEGVMGRDPERAPVCKEVVELVEAAWATLKDKAARVAYRKELIEPSQLVHSADLLTAQGRTAEFRSDFRAAVRLFEIALELSPNDATIQAELSRICENPGARKFRSRR